MNWQSVGDFVAMGGYGLYVWGSFGMAALALAFEVAQVRARRRHLRGGAA
ncbi:heme exporter protein CcmD [Variovorax rhizosphaerae]|uniref:Heme exporter protein D n=1 Tax=Variovorax rhizosphaerae TaxID=1836200 RepID=A0ABU8WX36_9BURK